MDNFFYHDAKHTQPDPKKQKKTGKFEDISNMKIIIPLKPMTERR